MSKQNKKREIKLPVIVLECPNCGEEVYMLMQCKHCGSVLEFKHVKRMSRRQIEEAVGKGTHFEGDYKKILKQVQDTSNIDGLDADIVPLDENEVDTLDDSVFDIPL